MEGGIWKLSISSLIKDPRRDVLSPISDAISDIFVVSTDNGIVAEHFVSAGVLELDEKQRSLDPILSKPYEWGYKFVDIMTRCDIVASLQLLCNPETSGVETYSQKIREILRTVPGIEITRLEQLRLDRPIQELSPQNNENQRISISHHHPSANGVQ